MDYRHSQYDRTGSYSDPAASAAAAVGSYKHTVQDAYDRNRKRNRSRSPYAEERRGHYGAEYPSAMAGGMVDPWDRPRHDPARASAYDAYHDDRELQRAAEWDRYYRERDSRHPAYEYPERERFESRPRYDDEYASNHNGDHASSTRRPSRPTYDPHFRQPAEPVSVPDPMQSESLLPFRAFAQMTRAAHPRSLEPLQNRDVYDAYQTYKLAFNKKVMAQMFDQRKHEAWFKEKYSHQQPWLDARHNRRRISREGKKAAWLHELQEGKLDRVNNDLQQSDATTASHGGRRPSSGSTDGPDPQHDSRAPGEVAILSRYGELEVLSGELAVVPACSHQILVKSYPADGSREKLEQLLQTKPGFQYLALGEPHVSKGWCRAGWAMYAPETDMEDTLNAFHGVQVDGFTLNLASCAKPAASRLRTAPEYANSFVRLTTDLKQCQTLILRFEAEDRDVLFADQNATWLETSASDAIMDRHRLIEPDLLEEDLERDFDPAEPAQRREQRRKWIKKHLDLHLDLLRTVYHCDYYTSLVCEFGEELVRRSPFHARKQPFGDSLVEVPRESSNDESWARSVDNKTALLLAPEGADLTEHGGKSPDGQLMTAALAYVKQEEAEKHRCTVEIPGSDPPQQCAKLFKAVNFVQKHVLNKHRATLLAQPGVQDSLDDVVYFNNYVRDPCRAVSQPTSGNHASALDSSASVNATGTGSGSAGGARMGSIRFGGSMPNGGGPTSSTLAMRMGNILPVDSSEYVSASTLVGMEPLPPAPKPLDPRASRPNQTTYQDLDTAAEGDVHLAY